MDRRITDVNQVLTFGREKLARRMLLFAAIAAGVGLLGVLVGGDDDPQLTYVGWGLIVFGVGWAGWEFSKTTRTQKPLLVLSPEGIHMRVEGATEFDIPWTEVHGVELDHRRGSPPRHLRQRHRRPGLACILRQGDPRRLVPPPRPRLGSHLHPLWRDDAGGAPPLHPPRFRPRPPRRRRGAIPRLRPPSRATVGAQGEAKRQLCPREF